MSLEGFLTDWDIISQNLSGKFGLNGADEDLPLSDPTSVGNNTTGINEVRARSWSPGIVERRRATMVGLPIKKSTESNSTGSIPTESTSSVATEDTTELVVANESERPVTDPKLEKIITFGSDGSIQDEQAMRASAVALKDFDQPVEPEVRPGPNNQAAGPDISLGNNAKRAQDALGGEKVQGVPIASSPEPPAEASQVRHEAGIVANNVVGTNGSEGQEESGELSGDAVAGKKPKETQDQTPIVTFDQPLASGEAPKDQANTDPKDPVLTQNQRPVAEAPAVDVAGEQKPVLAENEVPITYQPSGEQRVATSPDIEVKAIQNRINHGDKTFNQEVDGERAKSAESAIAPPPETPGVQEPTTPAAVVTADGEGVIGEIKSRGEGENHVSKPVNHQKEARNIPENATSEYFARLSGRLTRGEPTQEELPKAA